MSISVRYISNGFSLAAPGGAAVPSGPTTHYAASIPAVVYWLALAFEPAPASVVVRARAALEVETKPPAAPRAIVSNDPLMNQEALVWPIASGGYMVRQGFNQATQAPQLDVWCPNMDAVHGQLNLIFAPPPPEAEKAAA